MEENLGTPKKDFISWLSDVTTTFKSLNDEKRNTLLEHIIDNSEPTQLNFLNENLPALTCRDFLTGLSLENATIILNYLDGRDILRCCQVCKCWKNRIESLTLLWKAKAFEVGVNIEAVSRRYAKPDDEMSALYKSCYAATQQFLSDLKRGVPLEEVPGVSVNGLENETDLFLTDNCIALGEREMRSVTIHSVPDFETTHLIELERIRKFNLLISYKNSQAYTGTYEGEVFSWDINKNYENDSDSDGDSDFDMDSMFLYMGEQHKFVGHTSAVLGLDVIEITDETYVITGSDDKSIKVWKVRSQVRKAELFMSLDNADTGGVKEVHCLPTGEHGELRFFSYGTDLIVWSIDLQTKHKESSSVRSNFAVINSFYFDSTNPECVFTIQHYNTCGSKTLTCYDLSKKSVRIEKKKEWILPLSVKGVDYSCLLGVGSRFAFVMDGVCLQDFQLFDLATGKVMVTFSTSYRLQKHPIKLYDTSWLDGFNCDDDYTGVPTFLGPGRFHRMEMVMLDFPFVRDEDDDDDDDYDDDNDDDGDDDDDEKNND